MHKSRLSWILLIKLKINLELVEHFFHNNKSIFNLKNALQALSTVNFCLKNKPFKYSLDQKSTRSFNALMLKNFFLFFIVSQLLFKIFDETRCKV